MRKTFLFLVILLSGCANFTSSDTQKMDLIVGISSRPNIELDVDASSTINGDLASWKQFELNRKLKPQVKKTLDKSNMFGDVSSKIKKPNYELAVTIENVQTQCTFCNVINVLSLGIIPSWTNETFNYQAELTNKKTGKKTTYNYHEKNTQVRQILMLFAMPFMSNNKNEMHQNVFNNLTFDVARETTR